MNESWQEMFKNGIWSNLNEIGIGIVFVLSVISYNKIRITMVRFILTQMRIKNKVLQQHLFE